MPITTLFFNLVAIFNTSSVHFGIVKSIITLVFLNALSVLSSGKIPTNFLLINLFSVKEIILIDLSFFADKISCLPIRPIQPVIEMLSLFILDKK